MAEQGRKDAEELPSEAPVTLDIVGSGGETLRSVDLWDLATEAHGADPHLAQPVPPKPGPFRLGGHLLLGAQAIDGEGGDCGPIFCCTLCGGYAGATAGHSLTLACLGRAPMTSGRSS